MSDYRIKLWDREWEEPNYAPCSICGEWLPIEWLEDGCPSCENEELREE